jgi:hypothetical protein
MSAVIQLRPPTDEKPTVRGRDKNEAYRVREYLTEAEIEKLLAAAGKSRNPARDRLLVLMAYRHALRVSELVDLRVDQIDLKAATIHVRRAKNGTPGIHGLQGDELRLIRTVIRENGEQCRFLFISERGAPLSIDGAQKLIERLGPLAACRVCTLTCSGTAPAMLSPAVAWTPVRSKPSWATARSRTRSSTPLWPTSGCGTSGRSVEALHSTRQAVTTPAGGFSRTYGLPPPTAPGVREQGPPNT